MDQLAKDHDRILKDIKALFGLRSQIIALHRYGGADLDGLAERVIANTLRVSRGANWIYLEI